MVPSLSGAGKSAYFFPDRLLIYDSSGVGAIPYSQLNSQAAQSRFIEDGSVPPDGQQVDVTWRFPAKHGGPDRRFNNNRQLPVMQYGVLALSSASGLNDVYQSSVAVAAATFSTALASYSSPNQGAVYESGQAASDSKHESQRQITSGLVWICIALMALVFFVLPWPAIPDNAVDQKAQQAQQREAKRAQEQTDYLTGLNRRLVDKHVNATATYADSSLSFLFTNEGPNAARRDGVDPLVKDIFFKRFLQPNTESELCRLGIRALYVRRASHAPNSAPLDCPVSR